MARPVVLDVEQFFKAPTAQPPAPTPKPPRRSHRENDPDPFDPALDALAALPLEHAPLLAAKLRIERACTLLRFLPKNDCRAPSPEEQKRLEELGALAEFLGGRLTELKQHDKTENLRIFREQNLLFKEEAKKALPRAQYEAIRATAEERWRVEEDARAEGRGS